MIILNEDTIQELAQLTKNSKLGEKMYSAEQVFNMLCLHFCCGVPVRDVQNTYLYKDEDGTMIQRICYPEGHQDVRYPKVRDYFFKLFNQRRVMVDLRTKEEF